MELVHLTYMKDKRHPRSLILLSLGLKGEKLCGIKTDALTSRDRELIKSAKAVLSSLSAANQLVWFRKNCAHAYRHGYREIYLKNVTVIDQRKL